MGGIKKEYMPLGTEIVSGELSESDGRRSGKGYTVLGAVLKAFASCPHIGTIIITIPPGSEKDENTARASLPEEFRSGEFLSLKERKHIFFVHGGSTRRASVYNALKQLASSSPSLVLIHDGARPWIKKELIESIMDAAVKYGAAIPALPINETPKEIDASGDPVFIKKHLKRKTIYAAQTPQGFRFPEILKAHEKAAEREARDGIEYTDDAEVWGEFVGQVAVIPGDPENRKITYPGDLVKPASE